MTSLYALCRDPDGDLHVKRVRISSGVQNKIAGVFQQQAANFFEKIENEIQFSGDWKPDDDELLYMDLPAEGTVITEALAANAVSLPDLDSRNFMDEGIRALFTAIDNGGSTRVLIQLFSAQQILSRKMMALMLHGTTFQELTEPAFTLERSIVAVIENGKLKFKNFNLVKRIFELKQFYQEASNEQIDAFCAHDNVHVEDVAAFKALADQRIRKMVHAISKTQVLSNHPVEDIVDKAASLGLSIETVNGKLVLPMEKKELKQILSFLDDAIYEASLSSVRYITNSKRPIS